MFNRTNGQPVGAFGQQADPDRGPLMKKIFLAALVLTFAAVTAPAMAEQFANPFSQR